MILVGLTQSLPISVKDIYNVEGCKYTCKMISKVLQDITRKKIPPWPCASFTPEALRMPIIHKESVRVYNKGLSTCRN